MKSVLAFLLAFVVAFVALPAPATAAITPEAEPTLMEGLKDKGFDWLKDQAKQAGKDWIFDTGQSETMHAILQEAEKRANGEGADKKGLCQFGVMSKASSILSDINLTWSAKTAGLLAFDTMTKMASLASGFGVAAGEGNAINWLVEQYTDAAKDQAKDSAFDAIKKLFGRDKKPEFELYESKGKKGECDYEIRAIWDIVHGTYRVYISGDCHCTDVGQFGLDPMKLGQWWISFEGHLKLNVDKEKGTTSWTVLPATMDFDAQCGCSKRKLREAFVRVTKEQVTTGGGGGSTTTGPPPLPPAGRKVCKDCQAIQDEIDADQKALADLLEEVDQLNARKLRADAKLGQHQGSLDDPAAYGTTREKLQEEIEKDKLELKAIDAENSRLLKAQWRLMAALRDLGQRLEECLKKHCPDAKCITPGTTPAIPPENKKKGVSYDSNPFAARILTAHNAERAAVGSPPLEWNAALAEHAQAYADQLARTGDLAHASREGRGDERENLSQGNLWWSTDQMVQVWRAEKRHFTGGIFPDISDTGNWADAGHYSQMIWSTTREIGCGEAAGSGFRWLVCRYSPGGNKDGKPVIDPVAVAAMTCPDEADDKRM